MNPKNVVYIFKSDCEISSQFSTDHRNKIFKKWTRFNWRIRNRTFYICVSVYIFVCMYVFRAWKLFLNMSHIHTYIHIVFTACCMCRISGRNAIYNQLWLRVSCCALSKNHNQPMTYTHPVAKPRTHLTHPPVRIHTHTHVCMVINVCICMFHR